MALTLGDNFSYQGAKPLDGRLTYNTVAEMKAVADATMYNGCLAYCVEADKIYQWKSTNTVDETLGRWREFSSGGGGTTDYLDLDNKPQIEGVELEGDVSAEDLGLQKALTAGDGISIDNDEISIDPMPAEDMDDVIDELPTGGNIAVTGYVPLGTLIQFYGETAPKFFLACDGSTYNKADYPELAKHLLSLTNHSQYVVDGDNTKFKVPDLRGEFIRGTGSNSHANSGNGAGVGVHQDATLNPTIFTQSNGELRYFRESNTATEGRTNPDSILKLNSGRNFYKFSDGVYTQEQTPNTDYKYTSRPTNTSVLFCIAYKDIYSNPMNDYSTDEKVVGTWINGETLYQKTVELGALPNATSKNVAHNISNLGIVVSFTGVAYNSSGQYIPLNFPSESNVANSVTFRIMSTNLQVMTGIDRSSFTGYVTLQYTKTTD